MCRSDITAGVIHWQSLPHWMFQWCSCSGLWISVFFVFTCCWCSSCLPLVLPLLLPLCLDLHPCACWTVLSSVNSETSLPSPLHILAKLDKKNTVNQCVLHLSPIIMNIISLFLVNRSDCVLYNMFPLFAFSFCGHVKKQSVVYC